ncbi:hypothetical protein San01_59520 [Streptomyces angustmyceticus]|uniref:Uncharacterized protein n=1 Tax=Streptomyces angustmyceticus TaxID=285578 RepID=A0A5J4LLU3_9ACTN|nr:hypothetical protein San01_59520 [Streptomyces angustmyceticus]
MQAAASVSCRATADPADVGLGAFPDLRNALGTVVACCVAGVRGVGGVRVGVAVKLARACEAGVAGASRGHHGVRKGTHASFVGDTLNTLEVFGEKHTKG